MSADPSSIARDPRLPLRLFHGYRQKTGQSLGVWLVVALLNFATQLVFCHELTRHPGEFGLFNTALGITGLAAVPLLALNQAFTLYFAREHAPERRERVESIRAVSLFVTEASALAWVILLIPLLGKLLPLLGVYRFQAELFTVLVAAVTLGALVSEAASFNHLRLWTGLAVSASLARLGAGAFLGHSQPWAESGLGAFFLAGLITLIPALRQRQIERDWRKAWQALRDRDFLIHLGATLSTVLAIFLFTSADRIVALSHFIDPFNNLGRVDLNLFDGYQTAGLLSRALLWGTQPLLLLLYAARSPLQKTSAASLTFFWIYLGALFGGVILLILVAPWLSRLFCGSANDYHSTVFYLPGFALTMLPLGLLQGLAIFSLASRRHPECFVLGGSSLAYLLLLWFAGQPVYMLAFMVGGGIVSSMLVLFVGVVRWGRRQP
ncbi:MAG TPA: hypothetical protein VL981_10510 [Candidatus Methylacidiphilales bacterium]|nr:hypothetical protein [Candidatus Methylacidiphilales bacterium]